MTEEDDAYLKEVLSFETFNRIPEILARREARCGAGDSTAQSVEPSELTKEESRGILMRLRTEYETLSDTDASRMIEQIISTDHPELRVAVDRIKRSYHERENLDMLLKDGAVSKSMAKVLQYVLFGSPNDVKQHLELYFRSLDTIEKEYREFKAFKLIEQRYPQIRNLASDLFDPIAKRPF